MKYDKNNIQAHIIWIWPDWASHTTAVKKNISAFIISATDDKRIPAIERNVYRKQIP